MKRYLLLLLMLSMSVFADDFYFCPAKGKIDFFENNYASCKNIHGENKGGCHETIDWTTWGGIRTARKKIENNRGQSIAVQCILVTGPIASDYDYRIQEWAEINAEVSLTKYTTLPTNPYFGNPGDCNSDECIPNNLSFAMKGTLRLQGIDGEDPNDTIECPNIVLAQGSDKIWWPLSQWIYSNTDNQIGNTNGNYNYVDLNCTLNNQAQTVRVFQLRNSQNVFMYWAE